MDKLNEAIERLGGVTATARLLGVTQGCVSNWRMRGTPVPAESCLLLELHTKKPGLCEELRPTVAWHVLRSSARAIGGAEPFAEVQMIAAPDAANDSADSRPGRA